MHDSLSLSTQIQSFVSGPKARVHYRQRQNLGIIYLITDQMQQVSTVEPGFGQDLRLHPLQAPPQSLHI